MNKKDILVNSNSIGPIQSPSFAPTIMVHPPEKTSMPYMVSSAMDIDSGHNQPLYPSHQMSAQDRFIKRKREQRKRDGQVDSRQAIFDKTIQAKQLREQQAATGLAKKNSRKQ